MFLLLDDDSLDAHLTGPELLDLLLEARGKGKTSKFVDEKVYE
jgi:hypothetical protein